MAPENVGCFFVQSSSILMPDASATLVVVYQDGFFMSGLEIRPAQPPEPERDRDPPFGQSRRLGSKIWAAWPALPFSQAA